MKRVNAAVIRVAGTNCDLETCQALKLAGAGNIDLIHINALIRKETNLSKYQILAVPGGFSYGDDIASGKIFATQIKYKIWDEMNRFNLDGKLIIGICNGFQVLVKMGFLPGPAVPTDEVEQTATLTHNDSGKFECRWIHLKTGKNLWTRGMPPVIQLPVAHGEGKFIADKKLLDSLEKHGQIAFLYVNEKGKALSAFPVNPNGSMRNIAGITNRRGNILGLMPHPERHVMPYQHPAWQALEKSGRRKKEGDGLAIFRNAVDYAKKNLL